MLRQQNRQPATKAGVLRRLADARLGSLPDRRGRQGRRIQYAALLNGLMLGAVSAARALRDVEALTANLSPQVRRRTAIKDRISDTKLRDTLLLLEPGELRECLHRQVVAEHRRGNLLPTRLPFGVAAIDGKGLGKLDSWGHPDIQKVSPEGQAPYGLARVHRTHLVSSKATVCIDQRPIPGDTNEIGAVCDTTQQLLETYKRTNLFEVITADAGNCSVAHATLINQANVGYVLGIKENAGDIYQEALRLLANRQTDKAEAEVVRRERGARVTHRLWRVSLRGGYLRWTHARQLVRVQRVVEKPGQDPEEGNRYFVSNLVSGRLNGTQWLTLVRLHWRCENEGHWTADVVWKEDARRLPWIRVPNAVYSASMLRMIALNILSVLRSLSKRAWESSPVPWKVVVEALRFALAAPMFAVSERFDFE
jgi:predicted transposase YbfD/YdcC